MEWWFVVVINSIAESILRIVWSPLTFIALISFQVVFTLVMLVASPDRRVYKRVSNFNARYFGVWVTALIVSTLIAQPGTSTDIQLLSLGMSIGSLLVALATSWTHKKNGTPTSERAPRE